MILNFYKYLFNLRINLTEIDEFNKTIYNYFNNIYEIENINIIEATKLLSIFIEIMKSTLYYKNYIIFKNKKNTLKNLKQNIPVING